MVWQASVPSAVELLRGLASGNQNPALLYRIHGRGPDKVAVVDRGRAVTFAELDARIDRVAAGLTRAGLGRRARVVLMIRNREEFFEISAACARIAAAVVSVGWRSTARELAYVATHAGASAVIIERDLVHVLAEARAELPPALLERVYVVGEGEQDLPGSIRARPYEELLLGGPAARADVPTPDDAALLVYTSGTTGAPKGAVRKFPKSAIQGALQFLAQTPLRVDDVHLVACPLYHSTAFGFATLSQVLGATVVLMDHFDAEGFLRLVEEHGVTTSAVVPTMLQRLLDLPDEVLRRYDVRSLRVIFSGGAPLTGSLAVAFMDVFGDVLWNFYGATETGLVTLASPAELRAAPGTIGRAVPGSDIRLLDEARKDVAVGDVGELFVKNDLLIAGYHRDDGATRASMAFGYFSVGDLARQDAAGRYFLEGRKRDMIISGGVNVYPAEVEGVLEQHPDVAEAAVVGAPDRDLGERVRAFVVPRAGRTVDGAAVRAFARERLSGAKVPRDVVVLVALPRNPTGKVLKRELRERA
jgi:fatty-acyl-CoA synthase